MSEEHKNIQLPAFVSFPTPPPVYVIKDNGTHFYVEGLSEHEFDLVSQVEDYIRNDLKGEVSFNAAELHRGQPDIVAQGKVIEGLVLESSTNRMIVSHTAQDTINNLKEDYYDFLEFDREYSEKTEEWATAYNWVMYHPAFYHRGAPNATFWEFDNGWAGKWESVYNKEDGSAIVIIEHGPFLGTDRVQNSHDPRLDSSGETFEEAYVNFAKQVNKHYDILGEDRKLVEEEEPELF